MTESQLLIAKVNGRGVVWTSRYIAFNTLAYHMERAGSTKSNYSEIEEIEVRPASSGKGWEVCLYGDPVARVSRKSEAQREAESLLDNSLDSFGYPLQTCGRI